MLLPQSDANNPSSSWIGMIKESIQKNSTDYAMNMILKCVKECEANIPIPDFFNLYNSEKLYHLEANIANYGTIAGTNAPASTCTQCRTCVDYCTQQLDIPELLTDVADLFE